MTPSLIAAFAWLALANVRAMFPSRDHLWTFAYFLIALGAPIFVWLVVDTGWLAALLFLAAAASVLRWPVLYLWRWMKRLTGQAG